MTVLERDCFLHALLDCIVEFVSRQVPLKFNYQAQSHYTLLVKISKDEFFQITNLTKSSTLHSKTKKLCTKCCKNGFQRSIAHYKNASMSLISTERQKNFWQLVIFEPLQPKKKSYTLFQSANLFLSSMAWRYFNTALYESEVVPT